MGRCNGCQSAHCVLPLRLQVRHSFLDAGTFSCDCEPAEGSACSAACSRSCFLRSAAASAMSTGLHQIDPHKATCLCGAQGKSGCRMARPAGHPVEATRVLEIKHQVGCGPSNMLADCNAAFQRARLPTCLDPVVPTAAALRLALGRRPARSRPKTDATRWCGAARARIAIASPREMPIAAYMCALSRQRWA